MPAPSSSDTYSNPFYAKQVSEWMSRAKPEDKARFERLFSALDPASPPERKKPPPPRPFTATGWSHTSTIKAAQTQGLARSTNVTPRSAVDEDMPTTARSLEGHEPPTGMQYHSDASAGGPAGGAKPLTNNRELASLLRAQQARQERLSSALPDPRKPPPTEEGTGKSPNCSNYQATFNMRSDYPEMYAEAVANTRAEPAPNLTFISDWGDALKKNVDASWRERFMKSTYAAGNDDVYSGFETDFDVTKERAFFDWMQRQKTYFGELMGPQQKADFERAFELADNEQRREMLEGLRQLSAVAQPELLKSFSHTEHCLMAKTENPELTAMTSHMVKIKTLGTAPPMIRTEDLPPPGHKMPPDAFRGGNNSTARQQQQQRPASAASRVDLSFTSPLGAKQMQQQKQQQQASPLSRPGSAAGFYPSKGGRPATPTGPEKTSPLSLMAERQASLMMEGGVRQRPASATGHSLGGAKVANKQKTVKIETFQSKVPLKWAGIVIPGGSAYSDAYGSLNQGPRAASFSTQSAPIRYKEVTCPIGAVDVNTAIAPFQKAYPVPECYVQTLPFPLPSDDVCSDTVYRQDFYPRDERETVRSTRDAARNIQITKQEARRTEVPLGANGFTMLPAAKWKSDTQANFIGHTLDIRGDRERAEALKVVTSGPTASAGAVTASLMKPRSVSALA